MYCEECGSEIEFGAADCGKCGAKAGGGDGKEKLIPKRASLPERIIMIACGVVLIAVFFLPMYQYGPVTVSGKSILSDTGGYLQFLSDDAATNTGFLEKILKDTDNSVITAGIAGAVILLAAPFVFLLAGILNIFGKGHRYTILYSILITGVLLVMVSRLNEVTAELGTQINFYEITGPAFWISWGAVITGFVMAIYQTLRKSKRH